MLLLPLWNYLGGCWPQAVSRHEVLLLLSRRSRPRGWSGSSKPPHHRRRRAIVRRFRASWHELSESISSYFHIVNIYITGVIVSEERPGRFAGVVTRLVTNFWYECGFGWIDEEFKLKKSYNEMIYLRIGEDMRVIEIACWVLHIIDELLENSFVVITWLVGVWGFSSNGWNYLFCIGNSR